MIIKHMFAYKFKNIKEIEFPIIAELKYDGFRVLIIKEKDNVRLVSRNNKDAADMFPEIHEAILKAFEDYKSIILDGEIIYGKGTIDTFQKLLTRKRKLDIDIYSKQLPVKLILFDCLKIEDKIIYSLPFVDRRKQLEIIYKNLDLKYKHIIQLAKQYYINNKQELDKLFKDVTKDNYEGLMLKTIQGKYIPGKRTKEWIKLKRAELQNTFEAAIIGYNKGIGKYSSINALYVAILHNNKYYLLTKVTSGLSMELIQELLKQLKPADDKDIEKYVLGNNKPQYLTKPNVIVELLYDQLTKSSKYPLNISLRHPRILRIRIDVSKPSTLKDIIELNS